MLFCLNSLLIKDVPNKIDGACQASSQDFFCEGQIYLARVTPKAEVSARGQLAAGENFHVNYPKTSDFSAFMAPVFYDISLDFDIILSNFNEES